MHLMGIPEGEPKSSPSSALPKIYFFICLISHVLFWPSCFSEMDY